jgi:hypothetical protein
MSANKLQCIVPINKKVVQRLTKYGSSNNNVMVRDERKPLVALKNQHQIIASVPPDAPSLEDLILVRKTQGAFSWAFQ